MWNSGLPVCKSLLYWQLSQVSFMMELSRMALGLTSLLQFAQVAPLSKLWGGMGWGGCGVACLVFFF